MPDRLIDAFSSVAVRHLWQVTLAVGVLLLLARLIGRRSAHWAYALLIVAALKCLCPPVWSLPLGPFCWWSVEAHDEEGKSHVATTIASPAVNETPQTSTSSEPTAIADNVGAEREESQIADAAAVVSSAPTEPATAETVAATQPIDSADAAPTVAIPWTRILAGSLLIVWLMGSLLLLLGVVMKRRRLKGLVSRGEPVTCGPVYELVDRLRADLGLDVALNVVILDEPGVPGVFGIRNPTVVLPRVVLDRIAPSELRLVLAHELNHLRRQDTVCGIVQLLSLVVWWFHPLVWWMNSHLRRYREHCCDEEVVARLSCRPGEYARCLLNVLSLKQELQPVVGVSALSPFDVTAQRLKNLMRQKRSFSHRRSWLCIAVSALLAFVLLPGAALPRASAVDAVASPPPFIAEDDWKEGDAPGTLAQLYHSGIAEQERIVPEAPPAPPELTYAFQPGEMPSYRLTIEADEPEGLVTCEGTIAWNVGEVANGEFTLSRMQAPIVRSQMPRVEDGYFTLPRAPSVTWHGMHGGPIGPMAPPQFRNPTVPHRPSTTPPGWPEGIEPFGPSRQMQGTMRTPHPFDEFTHTRLGQRPPDRFSLAGGATRLGDPCWMPYGIGDAIDWIIPPLPAALDGGVTQRTFSWTLEYESRMPHLLPSPFSPVPEQARESAEWQVVEKREDEWVLSREIDRWSPAEGNAESPEASQHRLRGTALITWDVELGRPRGVEFTGELIRREGGSTTTIPVTATATLSQ
jgi:beta-lactamase regulating signal transducer with metallopeptidase domain